MQLKLELFEEGLDKYIIKQGTHKGKINQHALQTGNPKGTFKKGDSHPQVKGLIFCTYRMDGKNIERWYTEKDKERKRATDKEWRKANMECLLERQRKYRKTENGKAVQRKYIKSDKGRSYLKKYNKSEASKTIKRRYSKSEKGRIHIRNNLAKRRVIKAEASVNLTEYEEGEIKQIYAHAVRVSNKLQIPFHVDHIVPLSKGGLHHPSNMQICPASWNMSKNNKHTERWLPNGM